MTRPVFPVPPHDSIYVTIATDREAPNSSFQIYNILPRRDQSTVGAFRARFVERLGLDMLNARFSEMVQKPDPPFAAAGGSRGYFVHSADSYTLFGGVKEGGILRGFEAVLTETERATRFGFTATELERAKASLMRNQEMLYAQRDKQYSGTRAAELLRNFLQDEDVLGTVAEYELYKRLSPAITLDEVNRVTRDLLAGKNRVIAVNAPEKAGVPVPTEAQLLAVYNTVKAKTLEPYKDIVVSGPLVAKIPAPAAIVSQRTIPEIGVTEWKLANGVRVVLKPTDFMNDEIVLTGTSPGGTSLLPDSLFMSGTYASTVANTGGIGEYSAIDLRKLLTGKTASASVSIGSRTESVFGNASRKDVETMFQLVYLRFTAPRMDSGAFKAFQAVEPGGDVQHERQSAEGLFRHDHRHDEPAQLPDAPIRSGDARRDQPRSRARDLPRPLRRCQRLHLLPGGKLRHRFRQADGAAVSRRPAIPQPQGSAQGPRHPATDRSGGEDRSPRRRAAEPDVHGVYRTLPVQRHE